MRNATNPAQGGFSEPLTDREREIVKLYGRGLSNKEIASELFLAEKTIRWYNTQIYRKLGVKGRKQALAQARELGILAGSAAHLIRTHLPPQATPFVGRKDDLASISQLFADKQTRLLTILAPGGMGKTRLSIEVAKMMHSARDEAGVFFVPLAALTEPGEVILAIAEQIGFMFYGERSPESQLLDFLQERSHFLVLDNFEHVLQAASFVDKMIRTCPDLRVITTSRERLNLRGETVYVLRGLGLISEDQIDRNQIDDAVALFIQSAGRIRPHFNPSLPNMDRIRKICALTAGMPLALELAAGWLDTLSLENIVEELQSGLDILESDLRDLPERHRSLRATFERTWRRLDLESQRIFMRLALFGGGFTRDAAASVAGAKDSTLRKLSNKALIELFDNGRFHIHELLRQFGKEKLTESGDFPEIQTKHTAYYAAFMAERQQDFLGPHQLEAAALIDPDFENIRIAWGNALRSETWDELLKFVAGLRFYCEVRTRSQEGVALFRQAETVLRSASDSDQLEEVLGKVLARLGWFYYDIGLAQKSIAASEEAIRILKKHHNQVDLLAALFSRGVLALIRNQKEIGDDAIREGLELAQELKDPKWEGTFLVWSGIANVIQNKLPQARVYTERGLQILEKIGEQWGILRAYGVIADINESQGNLDEAKKYFQLSLDLSAAFGHQFTISMNHTHLARIAFHEADQSRSNGHIRNALDGLRKAGYFWAACFPLVVTAQMLAEQNELSKSAEILGTMHPHLTALRRADQIALALQESLETRMGLEAFNQAWERGSKRTLPHLVDHVLQTLL